MDRQLPQLFALLSLMLERGPLQIAWTAMKSQDRALRGTALEYLSNVLPADVFPRIRSCFGASSIPAPAARRPVELVTEELRASSDRPADRAAALARGRRELTRRARAGSRSPHDDRLAPLGAPGHRQPR